MNPDQELSMGNDVTLRGSDAVGVLGVIDQYEILRELGGGGFGTVYLARDTVAGIEVAVKGLPPVVKNNKEELENIRQNFALVSRLHHPNIAAALVLHPAQRVTYNDVRVHDNLRVEPGDTLMVMEYAPGVTLSSWRKQFPDKRVPLELAIKIVRQIASALDYAHREKILHRDIKPSNVMIETRAGGELIARVLDFGLAAEIRSSMGRVSLEIHDTSGTRPYMAPEQWAGRRQMTTTDQYALAVLFCELVSGDIPFASIFETGDRLLMMEVVEKKEPELPEMFPAKLRATMLKALSKDSKERYASCGEFADALESPRSRSKRFGLMIGVTAVVFSTVILAGMGVYRKHTEAKIAEAARQVEIARQAELSRQAVLTRQAEEKRQLEEKRQTEEKAKADAKRKAEEAAVVEEKRKKEAEAKAALEKAAEEKRLTEEKAKADAEEKRDENQKGTRGDTQRAATDSDCLLKGQTSDSCCPTLGVMTALSAFDDKTHYFTEKIAGKMSIRRLPLTTCAKIGSDIGVLLLVHPAGMDEETCHAVEEHLCSGGSVVACVDPFNVMDMIEQRRNGITNVIFASCAKGAPFDRLLRKWGILFSSDRLVVDFNASTKLNNGKGGIEENPTFLSFGRQNLNEKEMSIEVNSLMLPFSGAFSFDLGRERLRFLEMVKSSGEKSGFYSAKLAAAGVDALKITKTDALTVCVKVEGDFSASGTRAQFGKLYLMGDADFLFDDFCRTERGGVKIDINDNAKFLVCILDECFNKRKDENSEKYVVSANRMESVNGGHVAVKEKAAEVKEKEGAHKTLDNESVVSALRKVRSDPTALADVTARLPLRYRLSVECAAYKEVEDKLASLKASYTDVHPGVIAQTKNKETLLRRFQKTVDEALQLAETASSASVDRDTAMLAIADNPMLFEVHEKALAVEKRIALRGTYEDLVAAIMKRDVLLESYTDKHPEVVSANSEIKTIKERFRLILAGSSVGTGVEKVQNQILNRKNKPDPHKESLGVVKAVIVTTSGEIELALDAAKAPISVSNFVSYVKSGHYNGTVFHRVINGFMIQGGGFTSDMTQKETRAPIQNEASNGLKNKRGTIAMARTMVVDSATCQFFINLKDNGFLDYTAPNARQFGYAVFGHVTKGMDVVDKIAQVKTGNVGYFQDVPVDPVIIRSIRIEE